MTQKSQRAQREIELTGPVANLAAGRHRGVPTHDEVVYGMLNPAGQMRRQPKSSFFDRLLEQWRHK